MRSRLKYALLLTTALLVCRVALAQVDTEFWFASPEVSQGHGDSPLYLRISTLDKDATVTVTQPARGNALLASVVVPANTTYTLDLTNQKFNLEGIYPAQVMKTGLKIESSAPVTAYYEVGSAWNADIFALKGRNALGNRFVIPAQNFYNNSGTYAPTPGSTIDIVATSNNTVVKVRPTRHFFGHEGDTLIVIKLNAGETYSLRKTTLLASDNPAGTRIESSKPIAITLKDDSVINGGCHDLLGDQLVPVEVAGTEYIVLKGFLASQEYLFITAIEDDTELSFNEGDNVATTLAAGAVYRYTVAGKSTYVKASKPVYVFHVTGFGCEMGMAILPSITCKGSTQIGFSRTTAEFFGLNVLVRKEGIDHFTLNGSGALVPSSAFTAVPGTDNGWYTAQFSFNTAQIAVGQASLISNTENSFQIGIINGDAATTCRYGYFSAFSTLFIGDDFTLCEGEQATLDAGPDKESYLWSTGETTQEIQITGPGEYFVTALREECVLNDTINIQVKKGHLDLGADVEICPGETTHIDGKENFSWLWSNGYVGQFLETTIAGEYSVSVFDYNGCRASDTLNVSLKEAAVIELGDDIEKCDHESIDFNIEYPNATYLWSDGNVAAQNSIIESGTYWAKVFLNGCVVSDSVTLTNLPGPAQDSVYGSPSVCPFAQGVEYQVDDEAGYQFQWSADGGAVIANGNAAVTVDWNDSRSDAMVEVTITDNSGCIRSLQYPVRVNVQLIAEIPMGPDTLCLNKAGNVFYSTPYTNGSFYEWRISGGDIVSGQGSNEVFVRWEAGLNSLDLIETSTTTDTVCQGESPQLKVFVFQDSSRATIDIVSADTSNFENIVISWTYSGTFDHSPIGLYKRSINSDWEMISTLSSDNPVVDENNPTDETPFEYYATITTSCDEVINSSVHRTIRLQGRTAEESENILLEWTPYEGWPDGVEKYEVWRRLDQSPGFRLQATLEGAARQFAGAISTDGFNHEYVIRAVGTWINASWSNSVAFEFEHPVYVPNIITPNGDGKNEYFNITNIKLYKNSLLVIADRWGKSVLVAQNYQNDWNGDGLSAGIYYYSLYLGPERKYKGVVRVVR